jgi:hypothetical protein
MTNFDIVHAPWSLEQVIALNDYQRRDDFHEYTCAHDHGEESRVLVATQNGWVCPSCDYTQDWAHKMVLDFMMGSK